MIRAIPSTIWIRWSKTIVFACLLTVGYAEGAFSREGSIGVAQQVVNEVHGILGPITRELVIEDEVFSQENIETGDEGATRIVFLDDTELTMGPNSRVTLDRYVYDPDTGAGEFVMNFIGGVFELASGLLPDAGYDLRTPFANLTIRGTRTNFLVFNGLQMIVPEGAILVSAGGREMLIDDPSECLVWPGPAGGEPDLVPVGECEALIERVGVMTALLIEPAAGPPAPGPRPWLPNRRNLLRLGGGTEVVPEQNCVRLAQIRDEDGQPVPLPASCVSAQ